MFGISSVKKMMYVYTLTLVISLVLFATNVHGDPTDERFRILYSKNFNCKYKQYFFNLFLFYEFAHS